MPDADALLLSAGFGTRLRPLTEQVPKPLIEVGGRTLLEWNLELLADAGFTSVFVNVHYLGQQIRSFLESRDWGMEVHVVAEEPVILDTGGAVRNIEPLCRCNTLVVVNSDILLGRDFSISAVLEEHHSHPGNPIGTMVLREDAEARSYGSLGITGDRRIVGFLGEVFGSDRIDDELMFLGVSVWDRRVLGYMPERGSVFSLTKDVIPKLLGDNQWLHSYRYSGYWSDVGTLDRLEQARARFT